LIVGGTSLGWTHRLELSMSQLSVTHSLITVITIGQEPLGVEGGGVEVGVCVCW